MVVGFVWNLKGKQSIQSYEPDLAMHSCGPVQQLHQTRNQKPNPQINRINRLKGIQNVEQSKYEMLCIMNTKSTSERK